MGFRLDSGLCGACMLSNLLTIELVSDFDSRTIEGDEKKHLPSKVLVLILCLISVAEGSETVARWTSRDLGMLMLQRQSEVCCKRYMFALCIARQILQ